MICKTLNAPLITPMMNLARSIAVDQSLRLASHPCELRLCATGLSPYSSGRCGAGG